MSFTLRAGAGQMPLRAGQIGRLVNALLKHTLPFLAYQTTGSFTFRFVYRRFAQIAFFVAALSMKI